MKRGNRRNYSTAFFLVYLAPNHGQMGLPFMFMEVFHIPSQPIINKYIKTPSHTNIKTSKNHHSTSYPFIALHNPS